MVLSTTVPYFVSCWWVKQVRWDLTFTCSPFPTTEVYLLPFFLTCKQADLTLALAAQFYNSWSLQGACNAGLRRRGTDKAGRQKYCIHINYILYLLYIIFRFYILGLVADYPSWSHAWVLLQAARSISLPLCWKEEHRVYNNSKTVGCEAFYLEAANYGNQLQLLPLSRDNWTTRPCGAFQQLEWDPGVLNTSQGLLALSLVLDAFSL